MLRMIEGFETRQAKIGWDFNGSTMSSAGRFGGICAHSSSCLYFPSPTLDEMYLGSARKLGSATTILEVGTQFATNQMRLDVNATWGLDIRRGSTTIASTAGPVGAFGQWIFIEVRAKIADTGGIFEVKVDGNVVYTLNGDTANIAGADQKINQLNFGNTGNNNLDDVYLCDATGAEFNTYLGEIRVETLVANGNGAFSQLVGSDGNSVDNYLLVDEFPSTDTDRVESATVGQRDTYAFTNPTQAGQVLAVQPSAQISKIFAGDAYVKLIDRLANGTEHLSAAHIASNLRWVNDPPLTRDPENAVWTQASVSAAEFGVEVA